jgi:hypothetical protein
LSHFESNLQEAAVDVHHVAVQVLLTGAVVDGHVAVERVIDHVPAVRHPQQIDLALPHHAVDASSARR